MEEKSTSSKPHECYMGALSALELCSTRSILASLLQTHGHSLDEEPLGRNRSSSQPLTVQTTNEGYDFKPLPPKNLFTTKSKVVMLPPGVFQRLDYIADRDGEWVQHMTNTQGICSHSPRKTEVEINSHCAKLSKRIQTMKELLEV